MTLPGGAADKIGNRYELYWTADNLLRVLLGKADRIRFEPPQDDGVEFWIETGTHREYHQVKRQQSSAAGWTLRSLTTTGVIGSFWNLLRADPNSTCVFASTQSATVLAKLRERSECAVDAKEFADAFASDKQSQEAIAELSREWGCSEFDIYRTLKRTRFHTIDEELLVEKLRLGLQVATTGNVDAALNALHAPCVRVVAA